jgi:hypothetical protein
MKTATDRAAEAVEAAEIMFADEMGVALDLSPAAKVALIVKIAAARRPLLPKRDRSSGWYGSSVLTSRPPSPCQNTATLQH